MHRGRLLTVDDDVYEVVAVAPGGTSMLLVNRGRQLQERIAALEKALSEAEAELARAWLDAGRVGA